MNTKAKNIISAQVMLNHGNRGKKITRYLTQELRDFKTLPHDGEFADIFNSLSKHNSTRHYLYGNLFPGEISEIGQEWEIGYCGDVIAEMRWQLGIIGANHEKLNEILKEKQKVDQHILCNQYPEALYILEVMENRFGCTLWSLENKIFLYEQLKEEAGKEAFVSAPRKVIATLVNFWTMRASSEVSSRDYVYFVDREISRFLKRYPDKANSEIAVFYEYMVAPFLFQFTDEKISALLRYIGNMPLLDRYLCLMDICEYIWISSKDNVLRHAITKYATYLKNVDDPLARVVVFLTASLEGRREMQPEDYLWDAKQLYIEGNLEECIKLTKQLLVYDMKAVSLYVEVCQLTRRAVEDIETSENILTIARSLNTIYSMGEAYEEALESVQKIIFSCVHATWARDLYNVILKQTLPYGSELQRDAAKYVNMQRLTLETVCENLSIEEALDYLDVMDKGDKYVLFWKYILNHEFENISVVFHKAPVATLFALKGENTYDSFAFFLEEDNIVPIFKVRYTRMLWNQVLESHDREKAIDYFLRLYMEQEYYSKVAPMEEFMEFIRKRPNIGNIRTPLLYYINMNNFGQNDTEELTIACENFFYENHIERPSKMQMDEEIYGRKAMVFFLRYVCTVQIMGPVLLEIQNSRDLDMERIEICRCLKQIDSENDGIYDQEIRDITQKLYIYEGLNTIENSKIYVNTDGIKEKVSKSLKSDFNNYMFYRKHRLDNVRQTLQNLKGSENVQIISLDASKLFQEIVLKIRDEFVSSGEYGLDGYLSLNIRHGTLAAHLRAPLKKYHLFAPYDLKAEQYEVHQSWLYGIKWEEDKEKVFDAIVDFNRTTSEIIKYLKESLIQVSTEEKKTLGIFAYFIDDRQLSMLQAVLKDDDKLEDFVDTVFEYLWIVTEKNLEKMQKVIQKDISTRYSDAFNQLTALYKELGKKGDFSKAIRRLQEARELMDEELEKICHWFKRSAMTKHEDFRLEQAFRIGLRMIENIHPEKKFMIGDLHIGSDQIIKGDFLKNYVDIFYTLFDNVCAYAKEIQNCISIDCILSAGDGIVSIEMTNACDCAKTMEEGRRKLEAELKQITNMADSSTVKKEGGTGIPKIYKLLYVDLKMLPDISYNYREEEDLFTIKVEGRRSF